MKTFLKVTSIIVTCVVTFLITINFTKDESVVRVTTMDEATLPVVYMMDKDVRYNRLFGYTCEKDIYSVCDNVTILPKDRQLKISIDKYNSYIKQIGYEVRSLDGKNLYEDSIIKEYDDTDGVITANLNIKNLLEENEDYVLMIKLKTTNFDSVDYCTVIRYDDKANVADKVVKVSDFHNKTFDKGMIKDIRRYIETDDSQDNTNYGYVNIHSTAEMITYGDLSVTRESEPTATLKSIAGVDAVIGLDFLVSTTTDGVKTYYKVYEEYTITEHKNGIYLMGYERFMKQHYTMQYSVKSTSRIYLGISDDTLIEYKEDEKGRFTAYVTDGRLCLYDVKENVLVSAFTFAENEGDNVRETHDRHDIEIIDVNGEGKVIFAVYGYMNRGLHEGKLGISVCSYEYKGNIVKELKFIPVTCDYGTLKQNFGDMYYVDKNNTITLMIDGVLYAMDTTSHENTIVIDKIEDNRYSVSSDGDKIAYVFDNTIRVYSLKSQTQKIITCEADEKIRNIGYIDEDFIYGVAKNADININSVGNEVFPMYKLYILDKNMKKIKEYGIEGTYVTGYEIVGKRVNLNRAKYNADGILTDIEVDQLMNKDDNVKPTTAYVRQLATELRRKELYLQLSGRVSDARTVKQRYAKKVEFAEVENKKVMDIVADKTENVFAEARMYGLCNASVPTIKIASVPGSNEETLEDCTGIIINALGRSENVKEAFKNGKTALGMIDECAGVKAYNLTGCDMQEALNFVAMGSMVIAKTDNNYYVIIAGYTRSNVIVYDTIKADYVTISKEEFKKQTDKALNVFVSYSDAK